MKDEIWTTRDGTKIAVSDMTEDHVRNALRMILRKSRERAARELIESVKKQFGDPYFDHEAFSDAQARADLANPAIFFPLLDGGVQGSPELQRKYKDSI